jgi:hypothetical protein
MDFAEHIFPVLEATGCRDGIPRVIKKGLVQGKPRAEDAPLEPGTSDDPEYERRKQ